MRSERTKSFSVVYTDVDGFHLIVRTNLDIYLNLITGCPLKQQTVDTLKLADEDAVWPSDSDAANVKQSTTSLFQHRPITTFDSSFFFTLEQRGFVCSIITYCSLIC